MKAWSILAVVSTLALITFSCDTNDDNEVPAQKCKLGSYNQHFGNVQLGEHVDVTLSVSAASTYDPHIEGTARIDCPGFTFCDPESGESVDSFAYNLDYPEYDVFCIRFEPTEIGDFHCTVDFDTDCGSMTLTGTGVGSTEGDWDLMAQSTQVDLYDVYMDHDGYGLAVGDSGTVLRKQSTDGDFSPWIAHAFDNIRLKAVWKDSVNRVYATGGEISPAEGKIFRFVSSWEEYDSDYMMSYYSSIWGSADCDLYFGGMGLMSMGGINLKHYDCVGFSTFELFMGMSEVCGVSGSSSSDVWAVLKQPGSHHIYHYDGSGWSLAEETWISATLQDVYVSGDGEVFVVGTGGAIYHHDAGGWHDRSIAGFDGTFYGVWGSGADDVFVVGSNASIYHYNGSVWAPQAAPSGLTQDLLSVWGSGVKNVWAVGQKGVVLHYH